MSLGNSTYLRDQRFEAFGFMEIAPLSEDIGGWWSIGVHHAKTGRVITPNKGKPVIETNPIVVAGMHNTSVGRISLAFCMNKPLTRETLEKVCEQYVEEGQGEFSAPIVGESSQGVTLRQGFNKDEITATFTGISAEAKFVTERGTDNRGILPVIRAIESIGVIELGFDNSDLMGLLSMARELSRIE